MNSQIITAPDFCEDSRRSVLLISPDEVTLALVVSTCRTMDTAVNVYLAKESEDAEWFSRVSFAVDRIFKNSTSFDEIHSYLKSIDEQPKDF